MLWVWSIWKKCSVWWSESFSIFYSSHFTGYEVTTSLQFTAYLLMALQWQNCNSRDNHFATGLSPATINQLLDSAQKFKALSSIIGYKLHYTIKPTDIHGLKCIIVKPKLGRIFSSKGWFLPNKDSLDSIACNRRRICVLSGGSGSSAIWWIADLQNYIYPQFSQTHQALCHTSHAYIA